MVEAVRTGKRLYDNDNTRGEGARLRGFMEGGLTENDGNG
jgi:hypothetical protein